MLSSILVCSLAGDVPWMHSLENRKIVSLLRELEAMPSHLCLNDRTDFKLPWERGNSAQVQKTRRTCFHHLMLQQIFHLLNAADSHAAWNRTLLSQLLSRLHHSLEQLGPDKRRKSALLRFGHSCLEILPRNPSLSETKEVRHLCLGSCQSRDHSAPYSHVTILKEKLKCRRKL